MDLLHLVTRIFEVLQLAGGILLVTAEVEQSVAAQVEQDRLACARLAGPQGLVDGKADGVRGLGGRDDAFGARELNRGLEDGG
jgi:hypothetical protein